jgi:hypothetical protein
MLCPHRYFESIQPYQGVDPRSLQYKRGEGRVKIISPAAPDQVPVAYRTEVVGLQIKALHPTAFLRTWPVTELLLNPQLLRVSSSIHSTLESIIGPLPPACAVLFGGFPCWPNGPLQPQWDHILQVRITQTAPVCFCAYIPYCSSKYVVPYSRQPVFDTCKSLNATHFTAALGRNLSRLHFTAHLFSTHIML